MTVRQLETHMEARELQEWMAFFTMEPWGSVRDDYRAGVISATLVNVNGGKKGKKAATPKDFFELYGKSNQRQQSNKQQIAIMSKLAVKNNG